MQGGEPAALHISRTKSMNTRPRLTGHPPRTGEVRGRYAVEVILSRLCDDKGNRFRRSLIHRFIPIWVGCCDVLWRTLLISNHFIANKNRSDHL